MRKIIYILFFVVLVNCNYGQIINTLAGSGTPPNNYGYSGDGGLATAAQLYYPCGIAVDVSGNVYIVDGGNHRVRKVSTNGIITTIAGTGIQGFSGDNSLAVAAQLNYPTDVAVDAAGNVFIADKNNSRIRKVDINGIITTVAGNGAPYNGANGIPAILSTLHAPIGIAIDNVGNLYITESGLHIVRKIDVNGIINTIAGTGQYGYTGDGGLATSAWLNTPMGVAVDAIGNIYIADLNNQVIRKINSNGIISTIAGFGVYYTGGYNGDGGLATSAYLNSPWDIVLDAVGNLYIAESGGISNRIRKVNTSGIISTVAGTTTTAWGGGYGGDGGLAVAAELSSPRSVAIDVAGNLYISDTGNSRIRYFCSAKTSIVVPPSDTIICAGQVTTLTAGNVASSYIWNTGQTSTSITVTPPITTTYSLTSSGNCSNDNSATITISVNPAPYVNVSSANPSLCVGQTHTLIVTGTAISYKWNTGQTYPSIIVTPTITTTYSVTGTGNNGCKTTQTITMYSPNINISISNPNLCANEAVTLTAISASSCTWSTFQTGASITITPVVTAIYGVYGIDEHGCEASNEFILSVSPCTSIDEIDKKNNRIKIYPNPVNEILNVELEMINEKENGIFVYDILGNELIHNSSFQVDNSIDVRDLKSGIYFIKIGNATQKFVKE